MDQDQSSKRTSLRSVLTVGSVAGFVVAAVGFVADVPDLLSLPAQLRTALAALGGLTIFAAGLLMVRRSWNQPLGWSSAGQVALAVVGGFVILASPALLFEPFASAAPGGSATSAPTPKMSASDPSAVPSVSDGDSGPTTKPQTSASPSKPRTIGTWGGADLDPELAGSGDDLEMRWLWGDDRPVFEKGTFARVEQPSLAACQATLEWGQEITVVKGMLICIKTDEQRYVLIRILATNPIYSGNEVTYRVEDQEPL